MPRLGRTFRCEALYLAGATLEKSITGGASTDGEMVRKNDQNRGSTLSHGTCRGKLVNLPRDRSIVVAHR